MLLLLPNNFSIRNTCGDSRRISKKGELKNLSSGILWSLPNLSVFRARIFSHVFPVYNIPSRKLSSQPCHVFLLRLPGNFHNVFSSYIHPPVELVMDFHVKKQNRYLLLPHLSCSCTNISLFDSIHSMWPGIYVYLLAKIRGPHFLALPRLRMYCSLSYTCGVCLHVSFSYCWSVCL